MTSDEKTVPPRRRKDKNQLHVPRHAVLSKYPLEALARLGENVRSLRKIERKFRAELKPPGIVGDMWFDRFFSSYLRCVLGARAEAATFAAISQPVDKPRPTTSLMERELPTLVIQDTGRTSDAHVSTDLLHHLAIIARYDAHFSKDMYRAMAMLLILRSGGEARLDQCLEKLLGISRET